MMPLDKDICARLQEEGRWKSDDCKVCKENPETCGQYQDGRDDGENQPRHPDDN